MGLGQRQLPQARPDQMVSNSAWVLSSRYSSSVITVVRVAGDSALCLTDDGFAEREPALANPHSGGNSGDVSTGLNPRFCRSHRGEKVLAVEWLFHEHVGGI